MARLHNILSLLLLLLPAATAAPYSSLCPSPAAAHDTGSRVSPHTLPWISSGHFSGGGDLNFAPGQYYNRRFTLFPRLSIANATDDPAVTHLSARLTLEGARLTQRHGARRHSVSFDVHGYYSTAAAATAELCMVGSGSYAREDGSGVVGLSDVVLRLSVPCPSNLSRPFVTGSLEGAEFNRTALVAYPEDDYAYGEAASCPAATRGAARQVLRDGFSCSRLRTLLGRSSYYSVEYMPDAATGGGFPLRLRHGSMYVNQMRCGDHGAVRAYMVFYANQTDAFPSEYTARRWRRGFLVGDEALVADGFWDSSRSLLCLKACRVARSGAQSGDAEELTVAECGIGVSFWFPAVWSIRDRSVAARMIWNASSNSEGNTSAGVISVSRTWSYTYMDRLSGIKYNYTRVEDAKKYYDAMPALGKERKGRFPGNYSYRDFAFGFSLKEQGFTTGYASPVTIGSAFVEGEDELVADAAFQAEEVNKQRLLNVSYSIRYHAAANSPQLRRISAEGVYDTKTGSLCMVACQVITDNTSPDCEVLVTVQFAPMGDAARQRTNGTISSLRNYSDPLFFEALDFVGHGMYEKDMAKSSSRMDMESVMRVASMVLSCVFTALQLRHVKHHPEALPATSVTMLAVLALGHAIPLLLNLQDMYRDSHSHSLKQYFVKLTSAGALELNDFMQRVSTMLAVVLQLRLLQLALSRRSADQAAAKNENSSSSSSSLSSSDAERSTLCTCLPLYALGAAAVCIAHLMSDGHHRGLFPLPGPGIMDDLAAYAGLVLDGFLLPQVVWNTFAGSSTAVRALSPWFYAGFTVIRAAPHAYDAFRRRSYVPSRRASYVYASPRDDLFGVGWDVAVPCVAALLAAMVFLQQRLGGAFLCCLKRRRPGGYEMVPTPRS